MTLPVITPGTAQGSFSIEEVHPGDVLTCDFSQPFAPITTPATIRPVISQDEERAPAPTFLTSTVTLSPADAVSTSGTVHAYTGLLSALEQGQPISAQIQLPIGGTNVLISYSIGP